MSKEIRISNVVSSRLIFFIEEVEGVFLGPEEITLAEYSELGALHDKLLDQKSDMELIEECENCYIVEYQDDDIFYYGLHSDNEVAFKAELRKKILSIASQGQKPL